MNIQETSPLRVLVVDDDPDHVILIRRAIKATPGVAVETMDDSLAAWSALQDGQVQPDLLILDINMPGLSGLDVLERIKQNNDLRHIPVVMLTSSELPSDMARAFELGANGYISKPTYLEDLRAVLGNTLLYWSAMKRVQV